MKTLRYLILFFASVVTTFANLANGLSAGEQGNVPNILALTTKTPTQTPTSIPNTTYEFNSSTTNRIAPKDVNSILEEIAFFGMGGGGSNEDPCRNIKSPTVLSEWFEVEQLEYAWTSSCGWKMNKNVTATLSKPDGTSKSQQLIPSGVGSYGIVYWYFLPTAFDPTGTYKVNLSNGEQSLLFKFNVSKIMKTGATLVYEKKEIQIYNFRPFERVRVFRYEVASDKMYLKEWQEFKTASNGSMRVKINSIYDSYAIVGDKSGEYHATEGFGQSVLKANTPVISNRSLCSGAPKSKVAVGSTARVTFTDGTPTRIRKQPSTSASILGRIPEGTRFLIVDGPRCSDGYTWWKIELPNGTRGWMAEGKGSSYYMESMNYLQQACSQPRSRLSVGDQARVAKVDGSNMRIRSQPGFSQSVVDKVPEGTTLTILNGPKCVDGNNWWYIQTKSGIEGWMTESQNGTYLLEPMP